jgi:hypothetical protein
MATVAKAKYIIIIVGACICARGSGAVDASASASNIFRYWSKQYIFMCTLQLRRRVTAGH